MTTTSEIGSYADGVLGHGMATEQRRLQLMQEILDPTSQRLLTNVGLAPDWTVLEAGAGDGSIARWLAAQCPDGRVVATDVDVSYLGDTPVEVLRHDVVRDDFPPATFDLIHARYLLVNLPQRDAVIPRLIEWLKPGGWLVLEDPDTTSGDLSGYPAMAKAMRALTEMARRSHGAEPHWSRALPRAVAAAGLTDLGMALSPHNVGNGGTATRFWRVFLLQVRPAVLRQGLLTEAEFADALALFDDPGFADVVCTSISVWGRKT